MLLRWRGVGTLDLRRQRQHHVVEPNRKVQRRLVNVVVPVHQFAAHLFQVRAYGRRCLFQSCCVRLIARLADARVDLRLKLFDAVERFADGGDLVAHLDREVEHLLEISGRNLNARIFDDAEWARERVAPNDEAHRVLAGHSLRSERRSLILDDGLELEGIGIPQIPDEAVGAGARGNDRVNRDEGERIENRLASDHHGHSIAKNGRSLGCILHHTIGLRRAAE